MLFHIFYKITWHVCCIANYVVFSINETKVVPIYMFDTKFSIMITFSTFPTRQEKGNSGSDLNEKFKSKVKISVKCFLTWKS